MSVGHPGPERRSPIDRRAGNGRRRIKGSSYNRWISPLEPMLKAHFASLQREIEERANETYDALLERYTFA